MIILDAACMKTKQEAHCYLRQQLSLPDYYGKNLDALFDCLTDMDETTIEFVNLDAGAESYFANVLAVFREAEVENSRLHLSYRL